MPEINAIQIPGEFRAGRAIVTTFSGEQIDIILHVHQISIYEDMFAPFLTVELEIRDSIGLKDRVPFGGEEIIHITATDVDGQFGLIDAPFSIYKLKDVVQVSDRSFVYRLCCISVEAIADMNMKLSKAYSGQSSDLVRTLIGAEGLESNKEYFIEETKNKISYISNYWSPIQNIKYISDRAITQQGTSASCLFFETKRGFVFASLDTMVSNPAVAKYQFGVGGLNDVAKGLTRIEKVYIDSGFDYIDRLANGAYGNTSLLVDPYNKTYKYSYYDFIEAFKKQNHLNPAPFSSESAARANSVFRTRTTPSRSFVNMNTEAGNQWFRQRITEISAINAFKIQIEVAGRMDLTVGNVVEVYLYSGPMPQDGNSPNDFNEVLDKLYSGRYLITGIRHAMSKERHTMNISLSKDSVMLKQ